MTESEDLDKLLENLPFFIQENLNNHSNKDKLIEIVIDLGRRPEARFDTGSEYLSQKMIWPMKLAFYDNESKQSKPDYEITLEIDETGVVHFYEINYGDFIIKADLQKIKLINNPYCK